jgi:hypothetical protein
MARVDNLRFGPDVDAWVKETTARIEAVFKESTKRVVSEAQARIPVDTGFARASIRGSLSDMPQIDPSMSRPKEGGSFSDSGEWVTTIASARLGDTIYVGWTANYVIYLEYGSSSQAPSGFVRIAALQWQQIVAQVTAEAKSRALGTQA